MPAYVTDNVFAKILRGELPAERVYEDDATIVVMDIMPRGPGHVLVIPRGPSRNILDIADDDLFALALTTRKMALGVKAAFSADGVSVEHYVEAASGQTVFHTHVHVIPRFDGIPLRPHSAAMAPKEEIAANATKLRATLAAM